MSWEWERVLKGVVERKRRQQMLYDMKDKVGLLGCRRNQYGRNGLWERVAGERDKNQQEQCINIS